MSVSVSTTAGNQVSVSVDGATQLSFTTQDSSVNVTSGTSLSLSVTEKGPKGDAGIQGPKGDAGQGVPTGGSVNQVLLKNSDSDYQTTWDNVAYSDVTGTPNLSNVATSGSYNDLSDKPTIPTAVTLDLDSHDYLSISQSQEITLEAIDWNDDIINKPTIDSVAIKNNNGTPELDGSITQAELQSAIGVDAAGTDNSTDVTLVTTSHDYLSISGQEITLGSVDYVDDVINKPTITDTTLDDTNVTLSGNRFIDTNGNNLDIKDGNLPILTFTDNTDRLALNKVTDIQGKTAPGELRFKEVPTNGTNHVSLKAPASMSADANFVLPSADGSDGELLKTDGSGNLSFTSTPRKFIQVFNQNFQDDIGTSIHYLPVLTSFEQTSVYQEEVASLMPYDGRIKSVSIRVASITGSGNFTVQIRTVPTGSNSNVGQAWTIEESEVLAFTGTDDYHTFHFVFDNAQHFEAGDLCTMSLMSSADPGGFIYWYVTTLVEFDTSADLGSSSTEHTSNP